MTSKISFSKLVRSELRQLNWLTAVQFLAFGLLIPFALLITLAQAQREEKPLLGMLFHTVGFGKTGQTAAIIAAGIFCALCVFEYLYSQIKLDFYYSLALKRGKLFLIKFTSGALTFIAAYAASQILGILVGLCYRVMSPMVVLEVAVATLQGILFFLVSYSSAIVAVMLTGKLLTSVLAIVAMAGYVLLVFVTGEALFGEMMMTTRLESMWVSRDSLLRCSSPWLFTLMWHPEGDSVRTGLTGVWPGLGDICQFIALAVILTLIALGLNRVRRTEAAGSALAFRKTEGIIKLLLAVPAALLAGFAANDIFGSPLWELCYIILFGVLACVIMEFIYRWDIRQVLSHKAHIAVTVLFSAALFFGIRFDIMGVSSYLPEKEELASMAMVCPYSGNHYYDEDGNAVYENRKILDLVETEDIDILYPLAENGVRYNMEDPSEDGEYIDIYLKYHLKSGKEVYRRYIADRGLYYASMEELLKDEDNCRKYYPIMNWKKDALPEIDEVSVEIPAGLWDELARGENAGDEGAPEDTAGGAAPESAGDEGAPEDTAGGAAPESAGDEGAPEDTADEAAPESADEEAAAEPEYGIEGDTSAYVEEVFSAPKGEDWRAIEAYQKDLEEEHFIVRGEDAVGWLRVSWRAEDGKKNMDEYLIDRNCTHIMEVLQEILQ